MVLNMAEEPTPTNWTCALATEASPTIAVSTATAKNVFVPFISIFSLELGSLICHASICHAFWSALLSLGPAVAPGRIPCRLRTLAEPHSEALLTAPELQGSKSFRDSSAREL